MTDGTFPITGDPDADRLLVEDPLALLLGMLLDQQVPMEWAFRGPATLRDRLDGLDAGAIAAMDPETLDEVFRTKPALHRYPGSMAKRAHALCEHLVANYDGDAEKIWKDASSAEEVFERLRALPGYGDDKAKIFVAILVKRLGVELDGWKAVAAPFSDRQPRSAADVDSTEALEQVRAFKKAMKAKNKTKAD